MQPSPVTPPQTIFGRVIVGDRQGTNIGFPTANLELENDTSHLEPGVYLSQCQIVEFDNEMVTSQVGEVASDLDEQFKIQQSQFYGLAYFGPRLIFDETTNIFEVYLINFAYQIYGAKLKVELTNFIRPPQDFQSIEALKEQLEADLAQALTLVPSNHTPA